MAMTSVLLITVTPQHMYRRSTATARSSLSQHRCLIEGVASCHGSKERKPKAQDLENL